MYTEHSDAFCSQYLPRHWKTILGANQTIQKTLSIIAVTEIHLFFGFLVKYGTLHEPGLPIANYGISAHYKTVTCNIKIYGTIVNSYTILQTKSAYFLKSPMWTKPKYLCTRYFENLWASFSFPFQTHYLMINSFSVLYHIPFITYLTLLPCMYYQSKQNNYYPKVWLFTHIQ